MSRFIQKAIFAVRYKYCLKTAGLLRRLWYSLSGLQAGRNTVLPRLHMTWPHQVCIGSNCRLEHHIHFKFDGIWQPGPSILIGDHSFIGAGCEFNIRKQISIGDNALIASGCKFIDHDHGTEAGMLMRTQHGPERAIRIGKDVWLGCNVVILKGVEIGDGAIVAAGAIVTKSILPNEIWGGIPAKKIGERN